MEKIASKLRPFHEVIATDLVQGVIGINHFISGDSKRSEMLKMLELVSRVEIPQKHIEEVAKACDSVAESLSTIPDAVMMVGQLSALAKSVSKELRLRFVDPTHTIECLKRQ